MPVGGDLSKVVALLAEPARAAICAALLGGEALAAGELARAAGVSGSTASDHLGRLVREGCLSVRAQGRHRYYRLADDQVAEVVEYLSSLSPPRPVGSLRQDRRRSQLRLARTCYDHLAGVVAVAITDRLVDLGALVDDSGTLYPTEATTDILAAKAIALAALPPRRRPLVRSCLDWTERRRHVAGRLGAALLAHLIDNGSLTPVPGTRAVRITDRGKAYLARQFDVLLPE